MTETAVFANGCFWCTEAIYKRLKGIISVKPGYSGGHKDNPTYHEVSSGMTGHAEAIQIEYDPSIIDYEKIITIFFHTHDPTTLNRQGADTGTQYRSAIFYMNDTQKEIADRVKKQEAHAFKDPIVTEIVPFKKFYEAEDYHHDYYDSNRMQPYCTFVIDPKVQKLLKEYRDEVKDEYKAK
jgi:peptide-methionine (S)-S-oxide reductase